MRLNMSKSYDPKNILLRILKLCVAAVCIYLIIGGTAERLGDLAIGAYIICGVVGLFYFAYYITKYDIRMG